MAIRPEVETFEETKKSYVSFIPMAEWRHTGGDPLDYHNYEPVGEDEGCGTFLLAILLVVVVVVLMAMCS